MPTEEQRADIIAQYGDAQDHGLVDIRAEMTLDFGTVLIALVIAVIIVCIGWSWIEHGRDGSIVVGENRKKGGRV